jgi:hypothetical protein
MITVKQLASCVIIFTNEYGCFTIAALATVKGVDFYHGPHILSWIKITPPF